MKKIAEVDKVVSAVFYHKEVKIECSKDEQRIIRDALSVIAKVEKLCDIDYSMADMTVVRNYRFQGRDGCILVDVVQGAIG